MIKSQGVFGELIRQGRTIVDNFVTIRNRHTGEILRLSRVRDARGQIVLNLDGSLPPRASGPPLHVHFHQREEGKVKSGTLGAQLGKEKIVVPAGRAAALPPAVAITGGTRATTSWSLADTQFRRLTWIATSRRCLRWSTPARTVGHRSSI